MKFKSHIYKVFAQVTLISIILSLLNFLRWSISILLYPVFLVLTILAMREGMRFNLHPHVTEVMAADLPLDIWIEFERHRIWLARDGFVYICDVEVPDILVMKDDKVEFKLFVRVFSHPELSVFGGCVSLRTYIKGELFESFEYQTFSTDLEDGGFLETNNLSMPDQFAFLTDLVKHQLPDVISARVLFRLHTNIQNKLGSVRKISSEALRDRDVILKLFRQHLTHEFNLYIENGLMKADSEGEMASLTGKGLVRVSHRNAGVGKILFKRWVEKRYEKSLSEMGIELASYTQAESDYIVHRIQTGKRINQLGGIARLIDPLVQDRNQQQQLNSIVINARIRNGKCQINSFCFNYWSKIQSERNIIFRQELAFTYDNRLQEIQEMAGNVYEILTTTQEMELARTAMNDEEYEEYRQSLDSEDDMDESIMDEDLDEDEENNNIQLSGKLRDLDETIPEILKIMKHYNADAKQVIEIVFTIYDDKQVWSGHFKSNTKIVSYALDAESLERVYCEAYDGTAYPGTWPDSMSHILNRVARQLNNMDD